MNRRVRLSTLICLVFSIIILFSAAAYAGPECLDEADQFADTILDSIIQDGMNDYEKCCAVYDYIHTIPYINIVYSENWKENGYEMLRARAGDCFGYYSASRLLLERLGYDVIKVQNANGFKHVWSLVSTDHGHTWLHFDPTCWKWGYDGYLCMVTDDELYAYAQRHYIGYDILAYDWDRQQVASDIAAYRTGRDQSLFQLF